VEGKLENALGMAFRDSDHPTSFAGYEQALADEIRLKAEMEYEHLVINRVRLDDNQELPPIVLRARVGLLEALIINLPERQTIKPCECELGLDFLRYYPLVRLDDPKDPRKFLPIFTGESGEPGFACGRNTIVEQFLPRDQTTCRALNPRRKKEKQVLPVSLFTRPACPMVEFTN
jgi:hypothetical protein